jgi:4-hydroxy-3-methylbut-2-enyl diphosphate reductase
VALTPRSYPGRALVKRVLLASPRGYCAGVERAVETVKRALALYRAPVYVRKQIVHNSHVVPEGAPVVFSAHGVAPAVRSAADDRHLTTIDATCPLVTKVHTQARRYAARGYSIVLIGHARHEEVEGTTGEAPEAIVLVQSTEEAERVALSGDRIAYITQTTLSVDETREIIDVLRRRFPHIEGPAREDICYATSNRQWAVKELLGEVDLLLVVGSRNSSNSLRLVEVARAAGVPAHLVDDASEIDENWLAGSVAVVGVTSGASAPERLVLGVCDWFRARGVVDIDEFRSAYEDVVFRLPVELRRAERSAA